MNLYFILCFIINNFFFRVVSDEDILSLMSGRDMVVSIGVLYYEISVLIKYGIEELFFNVIRVILIERRVLKFWNF